MELSNYPLADLQTLQMAVAIAFEQSKKNNEVSGYNSLLVWSVDIDQAIKDRAFEDQFKAKTSVEIAQEISSGIIEVYRQFNITRSEYGGFNYVQEWSDGSDPIMHDNSIEECRKRIDEYWIEHPNTVVVTIYDTVRCGQ